jgi:hypothetical protein
MAYPYQPNKRVNAANPAGYDPNQRVDLTGGPSPPGNIGGLANGIAKGASNIGGIFGTPTNTQNGQHAQIADKSPRGPKPVSTVAAPPNPFGTESGNTYLEDRYLARLYGTDPAFNYAQQRGMQALGNQYSAAGMANSGAARQGESDFMANLIAQSQGQLDTLAAGATGARQRKVEDMFNEGTGIAGGLAGAGTAYDLGAAGNMTAAANAQQQMALNKAGVDARANQGLINNAMSLYSLYQGGGGGGSYYNASNPYPV